MAQPTNFLTWNPSKINQKNDGAYLVDTQRTGGAVSGIYPSLLANKLFYQCSVMVAAMATMMVNKGFEMQDTNLADLITSLSHILTDAQFGAGAGTVCQGNDPRLNSSNTKMWFYMNVAPTGWTIDTSIADAMIAVKGGTNAYNAAGGTQAGTWTQPGHTHTETSHVHATVGHVLSIAEMPAHRHFANTGNTLGDGTAILHKASTDETGETIISLSGHDNAHDHGNTSSANGGNTGANATPITWRPLANIGIICTKD